MLSYAFLDSFLRGRGFPVFVDFDDGTKGVIELGLVDGFKFYRVTIMSDSQWMEIRTYWEDGCFEVTYAK